MRAIADASGHVLTVTPPLTSLVRPGGELDATPIEIDDASILLGFCNQHEGIFDHIGGERLPNDPMAGFLFSYWSFCSEICRKREEQKSIGDLYGTLSSGETFFDNKEITRTYLRHYVRAEELSIGALEYHKAELDRILLSGDLHEIRWAFVEFDGLLPVVASGVFLPEYDFGGRSLQGLREAASPLEAVSFNITSFDDRSAVVFSWLAPAGKAPPALAASFFGDVPDTQKANAAICAAFEVSKNVYIDPAWWDARTDFQKTRLFERVKHGTSESDRPADCLKNYGRAYSRLKVIRAERAF